MRLLKRLSTILHRRVLERDMDEEMRLHIEMEAADLVRGGMDPTAARRQAVIRFGGVERFKEAGRGARGIPWLEHLVRDTRLGTRSLRRSPSFTLVAVATLALGIGANTAMFSVVSGVLLRPLPFHDSDRVVLLWGADAERGLAEQPIAYPDYVDLRARTLTLDDVAIWKRSSVVIAGESSEPVVSELASANLFGILGVEPAIGRVFDESQDAAGENVAVISHDLWQGRFGGKGDVLGKAIVLDGDMKAGKLGPRTLRIIGVMPAGFSFPTNGVSIWEPAGTYWRFERERQDRAIATWNAVGRLASTATAADAESELTAIVSSSYSPSSDGARPAVSVVRIIDYVTGSDLNLALWVLLGAVAFVLLIACANVANLTLARGVTRERELATRVALGAGRSRVAAQLSIESGLVVLAAGIIGVVLAEVALRLLLALAPAGLPRLDEVTIDRVVLLFTVLVSTVAGGLFGVLPALRMAGRAPASASGFAGGSTRSGKQGPARAMLGVSQCALAAVLLAGAGLMLRSYERLNRIDPGFDTEGLLVMRLRVPPLTAQRTSGAVQSGSTPIANAERLSMEIAERVRALPGVVHASVAPPLIDPSDPELQITIPGRPGERPESGNVAHVGVAPELFATLGVEVVAGRSLDQGDYFSLHSQMTGNHFEEIALVNESFASAYFPGGSPLGQRFRVGDPGPKEEWVQIVGVVRDVRRRGLERAPAPEFYTAVAGQELIVRMRGDPDQIHDGIRAILRTLSSDVGVASASTMEEQLGSLSAERRFQTALLSMFAALALALAAAGIYGLMHYSVSRRLHELGVRIALGARRSDVARLLLGETLKLALTGAALGLAGATVLTRVLGHFLFEVTPTDPATLAGVAALLMAVALLSGLLPTLRATRSDPTAALRAE